MKVLPAIFKLYYDNVIQNYHPSFFAEIEKKYKGDFYKYSQNLFKKSFFNSQEDFNEFLEKPSIKALEKDPAFMASISALELYSNLYYGLMYFDLDYNKGHRQYIAGLLEMHPDKTFYPDANFTMRMTYGTVQDYYPRDAVHYDYITTLEGVMEKEDPDNWEFVVPEKLKTLYETSDYGAYSVNGSMPLCFITNNDITGGNSGSPVINGEGHLIGIAFDGNWEAMSGDVAFEPELQRCISVDIRYILFIIDMYAGASHLIEEMNIVY